MNNYLSQQLPKELKRMIIWDFIDPVPLEQVLKNRKQIMLQFKYPKKFAVHQELLSVIVKLL